MSAQLDYNYGTSKGVPGGKVNLADDEVITRQNEEKDGVMKAGLAVSVGSSAGTTVKIPVAGTKASQIEGVVLAHANVEQNMDGVVTIRKESELGVMKRGNIWARTAEGAEPQYGEKALVVISGKDAGCFTSVEDTENGTTVDIGATFGKDTDKGIAVVVLK